MPHIELLFRIRCQGGMETMVPQAFASFFVGSMSASAALVGLLFVAVSIKPERITARGAPPEPQAVAASAFTALTNAFFISLAGAVPGLNLGSVALWASLASLAQTLNLGRKLWRGRPRAPRGISRRGGG